MRAQELLAQGAFATLEGRGREIDEQVRLGADLLCHRVRPVEAPRLARGPAPGILADRDADAQPAEAHRGVGRGGLEIAAFVEDVVGRQQGLAAHGRDLASVQQGGGVQDGLAHGARVAHCGAYDQPHLARAAGQVLERGLAGAQEIPVLPEVERRVASQGLLREHHELSPGVARAGRAVADEAQVAGDIADRGVYLG